MVADLDLAPFHDKGGLEGAVAADEFRGSCSRGAGPAGVAPSCAAGWCVAWECSVGAQPEPPASEAAAKTTPTTSEDSEKWVLSRVTSLPREVCGRARPAPGHEVTTTADSPSAGS